MITQLEFHQSRSYEQLEVRGVVDFSVVSQREVPTVPASTLQVQFLEVVDMPVVVQRQVPGEIECRNCGGSAVAVHRQGPRRPC